MKVRVTRTIEYLGEEQWVDSTIERSHLRYGYPYKLGKGSITILREEREEVEDGTVQGSRESVEAEGAGGEVD